MDNLLKTAFYLSALVLVSTAALGLYQKNRIEQFISSQTQNLLDLLNAQLDADQKAKTNLLNTAKVEVAEAQMDVDQARINEDAAKAQLSIAISELDSRKEVQNRIIQTLANRIPAPSP